MLRKRNSKTSPFRGRWQCEALTERVISNFLQLLRLEAVAGKHLHAGKACSLDGGGSFVKAVGQAVDIMRIRRNGRAKRSHFSIKSVLQQAHLLALVLGAEQRTGSGQAAHTVAVGVRQLQRVRWPSDS